MNQTGHNRLPFLAAEINENFDAFCAAEDEMKAAWTRSLDRALATGDGLRKAKTDVKAAYGHGEWEKWRSANCPRVDKRWSQVLMRLAEHRAYVERRIAETLKYAAASYLSVKALDAEITEMLQEAKRSTRRATRPRDGATVTQPGDLWELGRHNLICADSVLATDDWPLLDDALLHDALLRGDASVAELLLTDPPYGDERIKGMTNNHIVDWRSVWKNISCDRGFVFHAGIKAKQVIDGLEAAGFEIKEQLTWLKQVGHKGTRLLYRHEPIYYVERAGTASRWIKGERLKSVLEFDVSPEEREDAEGHETPKPVELLMLILKVASKRGDTVLDPFAGSGSTLIACERTGRSCTAIEVEPFYCDVIVRRWQKLTGRHAELSGAGRYDDLVADPPLRR